MGAKQLPPLIKLEGKAIAATYPMSVLRERVVAWSDDTVRRKISGDGFPAHADPQTGHLMFVHKEVVQWFKRRYGIDL